MNTDIIITGFSNPTSEGVVLYLNKKTSLKTGTLTSDNFWVSWDKIGSLLFDGYTKEQSVIELDKLRKLNKDGCSNS